MSLVGQHWRCPDPGCAWCREFLLSLLILPLYIPVLIFGAGRRESLRLRPCVQRASVPAGCAAGSFLFLPLFATTAALEDIPGMKTNSIHWFKVRSPPRTFYFSGRQDCGHGFAALARPADGGGVCGLLLSWRPWMPSRDRATASSLCTCRHRRCRCSSIIVMAAWAGARSGVQHAPVGHDGRRPCSYQGPCLHFSRC